MTDELFFDTDCLSAFLWINNTNILQSLYGGKIILPEPVYQELSKFPQVTQLKDWIICKSDTAIHLYVKRIQM